MFGKCLCWSFRKKMPSLFIDGFQLAFCSSRKAKSNVQNKRYCQLYLEADFLFQKMPGICFLCGTDIYDWYLSKFSCLCLTSFVVIFCSQCLGTFSNKAEWYRGKCVFHSHTLVHPHFNTSMLEKLIFSKVEIWQISIFTLSNLQI